ncbi:MAG: HAD family phosphatase [Clostridiales bacterium]|nr:HAD family phosphatase [Clostridiales bacterium]
MKITGAIFDFDGTVFDSMDIWADMGSVYLKRIGIEASAEISPVFLNLSLNKAIQTAKEMYGVEKSTESIISDVFELLTERYLREGSPKNDVIPFLERLRKKGVKMCIATATNEEPVAAALEKYDMLKYFGRIFTTANVGEGKTSPKMFRQALEFLGTEKSSTWVFEDSLYSAKTAKNDGFNVVGVYDRSELNPREMRDTADIYIKMFGELDNVF